MKAVVKTVEPAEREARFDHIRPHYLEALTLVERLHRRLLDVIKDEFDRRGRADINSVQALLLYNIGDKELTAGELRTRGYYLGSNVSYNLKKLVEMGFLDHQRSRVDRRSVRIKLTDKGREVRDTVDSLYQKHVRTVEQVGGINADEFNVLNKALHRLERFWTDQNSLSALNRAEVAKAPLYWRSLKPRRRCRGLFFAITISFGSREVSRFRSSQVFVEPLMRTSESRDASKFMILVWFLDLKLLCVFAV